MKIVLLRSLIIVLISKTAIIVYYLISGEYVLKKKIIKKYDYLNPLLLVENQFLPNIVHCTLKIGYDNSILL